MVRMTVVASLAALALGAPLAAQDAGQFFVEARAGAMVPTFDIADVVTTGTAFGGTIGYQLTPRLTVLGEVDYGMHEDKLTKSVDITTMHFMAKLGYALTAPRERGLGVSVNLGAGAVSFDVDGEAESYTYAAINAGAKITYKFSRSLAFVLSPQGDIVFSKEEELTTNNAWVWPVTAGLRITF